MPRLLAPPVRARSMPFSGPKLKLRFAPNANLDLIQQQAVCKFAKLKPIKAIAWWRVGLGKTRLSLCLLALLAERHNKFPFVGLVVARPAFEYDLRSELAQIGFDCQLSTEKNGWRLSVTKPTIFFCSFASLQKVKNEMQICKPYVKLIIADELYLYANPRTARSRSLQQLCYGHEAIGLSGSILSRGDNFSVWGQICALGFESKVARGATRFRSEFQTSMRKDFGRGPCLLFQNKPGWQTKLFGRIAEHIDVQFPKTLNRTIEKITTVPLTNVQQSLIKDLVDNFYMEVEGYQWDLTYIFQTLSKIRGVLNGWVALNKGVLHPIPSYKVSTLVDQLVELHECKEQVIVWCAFRNDVKFLQNQVPFATLQMVGGSEFDVDAWKNRRAMVTFATLGSGSSVNHFAQTPYAKFFSLNYRPLDLQQAKGRTDRRSTNSENVFYEYFQCDKSLDQEIFRHIQNIEATENNFIKSAQLWLTKQHGHSGPVTTTSKIGKS